MTTPRPVSRHHVLSVAPLLAGVPSHLVKTLMCLATHANHKTGLSRPGLKGMEKWEINYKTWHRQCQQLAVLKLIEQTQLGSKQQCLAAEYRMLFVEPEADTAETPTTSQGKGINVSAKNNPSGRGSSYERRPWLPLTQFEQQVWLDFAAHLDSRLDRVDEVKLKAQSADFDQLVVMQRVIVRLVQQGHGGSLIEALTERRRTDQPTYQGARNAPAAMYKRLEQFAGSRHVPMYDGTPVEPEDVSSFEAAADRLGLQFPGQGHDDETP